MAVSAASWAGNFVGNFITGIENKIPGLQNVVDKMKSIMNQVHQSYNPELPAQTWGKHFVENYASGMKENTTPLETQTNNVKGILSDGVGPNSNIADTNNAGGNKSVVMNFGNINIAKEVDAKNFIDMMKRELTRELQLQQMASI